MTPAEPASTRRSRLVDIVFPGDTNHHQTLFGGVGLSFMDKVAFIAASRHAPADFVTASCETVDFDKPARVGDIVEAVGHIVRVGRRSLAVEVDLLAEAPLTGDRWRCGGGTFNMVAVGGLADPGGVLPPLDGASAPEDDEGMSDVVFPDQTSHYGSLYGGNALAAMGKAAFVAATRHCRKTVVMVSTERVDFSRQIGTGDIVEVRPRVVATGRTSITVEVELWSEDPRKRERTRCGSGRFVMVAIDADHRPVSAG
ncbi:acyl-CoA thioesterase [Amorphus sp. 3PC139-8]|uniref:acyl-CoA thioesterase n=1 Tax=Amorphus sp. 3PC139-8 TaxID=2735676 RepID=UPI00345CAA24